MDTEARFQALEDKIRQQDKKLRLHKRLGLIASALLIGATAFAATRPVADSIEARKFVVKNSSGEQVAILGMLNGEPSLALLHEKRQLLLAAGKEFTGMGITKSPSSEPEAVFGVSKDTPTLAMSRGKEKLALNVNENPSLVMWHENDRLLLTASNLMTGIGISGPRGKKNQFFSGIRGKKGELKKSQILLADSQGKGRLFLSADDKNGNTIISFNDSQRKSRVQIVSNNSSNTSLLAISDSRGINRASLGFGQNKKGGSSPILIFSDSAGKDRIAIKTYEGPDEKKGMPSFELYDSSEKLRTSISIIDDKVPGLIFHDQKGRVRAALGLREGNRPVLRLLDEKETPIWTAPPGTK